MCLILSLQVAILIHVLMMVYWYTITDDITKWPLMLSRACMEPNSDFYSAPLNGANSFILS